MLSWLLDAARWRQKRATNIAMARKTRATLTDTASHWRYAPEDERVQKATAHYVRRARRAHAIAMGREPVIKDIVIVDNGGGYRGPLYATNARMKESG